MAAQVLAGLGTNGVSIGKRDLSSEGRGEVLNSLVEHASGLYVNQVKPVIENALNGNSMNKRWFLSIWISFFAVAVLHLAGVLANFSQNGFGRR